MAFFGLTALGPHPFTSSEVNTPTLHLFTENDLKVAWNKSDGEDTLPLESLSEFLTALYYGTPPESELHRLNELIQQYVKDGRISWAALRKTFLAIQEQALLEESNKVPPSERLLYSSNRDYRDAVRRHNPGGVKEKAKPLTSNQSYGWKRGNEAYDMGPPRKIRGKKSCPETLYSNELIKSGFIY